MPLFRNSNRSSQSSTASGGTRRSSTQSNRSSTTSASSKPPVAQKTKASSPKPKSPMRSSAQSKKPVPDAVKQNVMEALRNGRADQVSTIIKQYPGVAACTFAPFANKSDTQETLLSAALLHLAPLSVIQMIFEANPEAIRQGNKHGMSALHQAATVATTFDVMLFLVTKLKTSFKIDLGQLAAPGNWSVMHICCRCGVLPLDSFERVLQHAKTTLAVKTTDKGSTPLHLAIFGVQGRTVPDQKYILQQLIQAYPYAVNTQNLAGYTPVALAQHQANKKHLPSDVLELMQGVQVLVRRKYGTRVHVEQAIEQCQAKMEFAASRRDLGDNGYGSSFSTAASGGSGGGSRERTTGHRRTGSATDKKDDLRQGMLAHIEMQMLLPLRNKFPSEKVLRGSIQEKTMERARLSKMGPQYYSQTEALNDELIKLEEKLQREMEAKVPREVHNTRMALVERIQADTHMLPINNVSLQYLNDCTNNFDEANRIGKGGFGSVYRAYDPVACTQYAVKKTEKFDDPSLLREVEVLAQVFHPNVINLLGFYVPPEGRAPEFLVYEFAAGGTVADMVKTDENRTALTWSFRLSAAVGIASGLNYLHHGMKNKILHHDIKPENIVFTETLDRAILIDCGISKVLKDHQVATFNHTMAGTPFYLPDDYTEDTPYDEKCEVFSYGMVLRVLISGKMPKSLRDRSKEIVADELAGTWPPGVLESFTALTTECVAAKANDRPTIKKLYERLMLLEANAEKNTQLTEKQEETINETLAKSRQVSRASRKLEATGLCYCSRTKKKGLYCPAKKHFQCSECFNKFVLDCLGEEVYCRETCSCREPYTLDELHHHLRRSVLCRHVESLMKNRELEAYKSANGKLMGEIGKGFDRVMKGMTNLAKDELKCPLLALLIPSRSDRGRSVMRRALRSWKTSTTKTFYLYFLCAHDRSLVPAPIRVDATRNWVKKATPFLRAVLAGLQIAVMTMGLPISIPMIENGRRDDGIAENLNMLDEMLVDVAGDTVDRDMQGVLNAMQGSAGEETRLSSESYRLVAELANQPDNTTWRELMVLSESNGELAWVRTENEAAWRLSKKKGSK